MSKTTLRSLFAHKTWADDELHAAVARLPAGEALQQALRPLNHMHIVDRIFRAHLAGEPRPFDATHTPVFPPLAELRAAVAETDAWYEAYVAQLPQVSLSDPIDFVFTDGDRGHMSREEILMHVITHGSSHRGNVGQVLKSAGATPPRDLFTKFLHQSEPQRRS
jgi:uncharacterized damage-inducible protein DinB